MTEAFTMIVNGISEAGAKGPSADEKNVSAGVDLDADGNVEVSESEEKKQHGMHR